MPDIPTTGIRQGWCCVLYSIYCIFTSSRLEFPLLHLLLLNLSSSAFLLGPVLIPAGGETLLFFTKPSSPPTIDRFISIFFIFFSLNLKLLSSKPEILTVRDTSPKSSGKPTLVIQKQYVLKQTSVHACRHRGLSQLLHPTVSSLELVRSKFFGKSGSCRG